MKKSSYQQIVPSDREKWHNWDSEAIWQEGLFLMDLSE